MQRIIQPSGPPAKRITLEVDARGVVKIVAVHLAPVSIIGMTQTEVAMTPMEAVQILSKVTADVIAMMIEQGAAARKLVGLDGGANEATKTD